jgi:hypothetical protein
VAGAVWTALMRGGESRFAAMGWPTIIPLPADVFRGRMPPADLPPQRDRPDRAGDPAGARRHRCGYLKFTDLS